MGIRRSLVLPACLVLAACSGGGSGGPDASTDAPPDVVDAHVDAPGDAPPPDAPPCNPGPEDDGPYAPVTISGNPAAKGAIDPSVVYPAGATSGLMTYTAVPDEAHDHIAIASSSDHGATWQYAGDVTQAKDITITTSDSGVCGAATCSGTLVHESSSLVVDPDDPDAARRLKVFVHSYFFGSQRHLELGYLALYTAPAPAGPWAETKLFGWSSSSSISSDGVEHNVGTDPALPQLHGCFIVGEPGALYREPGVIDLALSCVQVATGSAAIDVRLIRSTDHGHTWSFVSTLIATSDAAALGSTVPEINGADLFQSGGRTYVVVTPTGQVDFPGGGSGPGYRGCVVVPIADIETGTVERCDGKPAVAAAYRGQPGQFVGACSADEGASANGMLIPVPDFSNPAAVAYRIYAAGKPLP